MSPFKRWVVLGIVSSALLLIVMDMTILYTALPSLTHDLGASASEKLWILNGYSLVMAGLQVRVQLSICYNCKEACLGNCLD